MGRVPGSQGTWDSLHFEFCRPAPLSSLGFPSSASVASPHVSIRIQSSQSAMNAGCTDYLLKPVDFAKLDEILQQEVPL